MERPPQRNKFAPYTSDNITHPDIIKPVRVRRESIEAEEVQDEVERVRAGLGSEQDLRTFLEMAVPLTGGSCEIVGNVLRIELDEAALDLRAHVPESTATFEARVSLPVSDGQVHLTRTHPLVEALAARVLDAAMSPSEQATVKRSGSTSTASVNAPTVAMLVRHRVLLTETEGNEVNPSLVEHCEFLAVDGLGSAPNWFVDSEVEELLDANELLPLAGDTGKALLQDAIANFDTVQSRLDERSDSIAAELLADHNRVREASKRTGVRFKADTASTADVIGMYALLPAGVS